MKFCVCLILAVLLAGCAPPRDTANICSIFLEKDGWYASAKAAARRWAVAIPVQLAIINQESSFVEDARPPRLRFHGIPLWRPTSAYGFGQAIDQTWDSYVKKVGNSGADRDDFADAVDFVGWYMHESAVKLGLGKHDGYNHYLAYHEGHAGFQRETWRGKPGLQSAARKVAAMAARYQRQLGACQRELGRSDS